MVSRDRVVVEFNKGMRRRQVEMRYDKVGGEEEVGRRGDIGRGTGRGDVSVRTKNGSLCSMRL